jgi:RNA polymerase sigma factor (sigma-70 family)
MMPAKALQLGDEAELYARYAPRLVRIVARQVRTSSANVEDACSHAWLQMLRYQPARETLLSWLVRTGTREAVKLDRRARRGELFDGQAESESLNSHSRPIDLRLDLLAARDAIADARLRPREVELLAAHLAGYSYTEIAAAKDITLRTVERQLLRAKHKLCAARERQQREVGAAGNDHRDSRTTTTSQRTTASR